MSPARHRSSVGERDSVAQAVETFGSRGCHSPRVPVVRSGSCGGGNPPQSRQQEPGARTPVPPHLRKTQEARRCPGRGQGCGGHTALKHRGRGAPKTSSPEKVTLQILTSQTPPQSQCVCGGGGGGRKETWQRQSTYFQMPDLPPPGVLFNSLLKQLLLSLSDDLFSTDF